MDSKASDKRIPDTVSVQEYQDTAGVRVSYSRQYDLYANNYLDVKASLFRYGYNMLGKGRGGLRNGELLEIALDIRLCRIFRFSDQVFLTVSEHINELGVNIETFKISFVSSNSKSLDLKR